jgi:hypothetical protein
MKGSRYSDEQVARVCHAANAALQEVQEPDGGASPSGPWMSEGPERMRIVIEGVITARRGITPRQHHDNWVTGMRKLGWTYGPKDPAAKTHPNIRDYDDLSQYQRDKDRLFLAIVTALTLTD